jgi:hypothetical protein
MPPLNRVVAVLTPAFSAVAAVGAAWLRKHFPGLPTPSSGQILGVEIAGATAAGGAALSWLKGHQQWEARIDEAEQAAINFVGTVKNDAEKAAQPAALDAVPSDPEAAAKLKAEGDRVEALLAEARALIEGKVDVRAAVERLFAAPAAAAAQAAGPAAPPAPTAP